MGFRIRPFTPEDYPAIVEIGNRVYPEYPNTVEEARHWDEARDSKCRLQRYVTLEKDVIVAVGEFSQNPWRYHPQKFDVHIDVNPNHQGRGIGSTLYEHLMAELKPLNPIGLRARAREDYVQSVRFIQKRSFVEAMRDWESRLDLQKFDFTPYKGHTERVENQGIRFLTLAELSVDPMRDHKLYDLENDIQKDVPSVDRPTPLSFEIYVERMLKNPNLFPQAWYIALDGDRYAGTSALWKSQANPKELYTGLTGVRRDYRRRGIALALKLKTLSFAKTHNYEVIKTWNESNNRAMLSINEQLGYVKQPAWITFAKEQKDASGH